MQEYLRRSRLSGVMDGIGFHLAAALGSIGWFFLLWGARVSSLAAGVFLYFLLLLLRRKIRDDHLKRKEKSLRAAIGGELALERLVLSDPGKANFETAMLLSMRWPLILIQAREDGVLCQWRGKKAFVVFCQAPESYSVDGMRVMDLQRKIKAMHWDQGLLCVPCGISREAREQAVREPRVYFLPRDRLIALFGSVNPANNEDLVALGKRKKARPAVSLKEWMFHPRRARRYAWYGALLLCMYEVTHIFYYALPGLVCVLFAAACRCVRERDNVFSDSFVQ